LRSRGSATVFVIELFGAVLVSQSQSKARRSSRCFPSWV
jgi:hypothetical protein